MEAKCLVAGTTTSQGIELFSNQGSRRYYRGTVRNVEAQCLVRASAFNEIRQRSDPLEAVAAQS